MKRLICITALILLSVTGIVLAEIGITNLQTVQVTGAITKGTRARTVKNLSGIMTIQPNGTCSVFVNATSLYQTTQRTGFPIAANTSYQFNVSPKTHLAFTCASTAANSNLVYIAR